METVSSGLDDGGIGTEIIEALSKTKYDVFVRF